MIGPVTGRDTFVLLSRAVFRYRLRIKSILLLLLGAPIHESERTKIIANGNFEWQLPALPVPDACYYWFVDHGGMTQENGQRICDMFLSRGNTDDQATLYRAFTGHDPSVERLL